MKGQNHLGCQYWFEAYLQKSTLDGDMWNKTMSTILQHIGIMRTLRVAVSIENNMVRYYFGANKDLTELSNALEYMSFRPIDPSAVDVPIVRKSELFISLVSGGNLLDLRERASVNRGTSLEWAVFSLRRTNLTSGVYGTLDLLFRKQPDYWTASRKRMFVLPGALIAVNFRENEKYAYKKFFRHLDIKKSLHILRSENNNALMEVETYPYLPQNAFFDLSSYDFDKHSFIVGASGSGKSKFIELFIDRLLASPQASQYRVVVVDPHASLEQSLRTQPGANVVNFRSRDDSPELFADTDTDISAASELTSSLFQSLLGSSYTPKVERLLRYSMTSLMTAQVMSLPNLKRFLTDNGYRQNILEHVQGYVPENIADYFAREYSAIFASKYSQVVVPLIELVDEIELRSGVDQSGTNSLASVVDANPLTIFSLNKVSMGEKVIKTVAGLLIQQLFLLAQARHFNEKIILIIDEVSVIQNPTIAQILAEARKYNMFVFLSQQYFGQVNQDLQNAIFSNVSNYFVFKVSEADARTLEGNITMELPRKVTMEATRTITNMADKRVPILTSLNPRDCVVRVSSQGKVLPAFKARTLDFDPPVATEQVDTAKPLVDYDRRSMPKKYSESVSDTSTIAVKNKPQETRAVSMNLMEVLSRGSSHRNKRKDT